MHRIMIQSSTLGVRLTVFFDDCYFYDESSLESLYIRATEDELGTKGLNSTMELADAFLHQFP